MDYKDYMDYKEKGANDYKDYIRTTFYVVVE
nr:MAG TPA: hypothetical protein [Caudoviricetes sp.]DAY76565.1 MAG TPA: hypothetical protein [Caudoviricetes sp.]